MLFLICPNILISISIFLTGPASQFSPLQTNLRKTVSTWCVVKALGLL